MKKYYLIFLLLLVAIITKSQEINSSNKWSIELGTGYNTFRWKFISLDDSSLHILSMEEKRNHFNILPSLKIKYIIPIKKYKNSSLIISPFVGYNMFGGKSKTEDNGYKNNFIFQSIEFGLLPTYIIKNNICIYGGLKGQYIFNMRYKEYGSRNAPIDADREWITTNNVHLMKNNSFSIGAGVNYNLKKIIIGIESWIGISNLATNNNESYDIKFYENNFRLIIGYKI